MGEYYEEYLRNFLVRGAINARAFWTTKEGSETIVEPADAPKAKELKEYVDRINKTVDLDSRLRLALIKAQIWGKAGFEVEFKKQEKPWAHGNEPVALRSLKSSLLTPEVDLDNWKLKSFEYNGQKGFYNPEEVLYFSRNELDDDWQGRSDIEPILAETAMDDRIIREDLLEAATTLWSGIGAVLLDLEKAGKAGITDDDDVDKIEGDMRDQLKPGKWLVTDDLWKFEVHDIKPDLRQLLDVSDKIERRILGRFGVPRFMLNLFQEGWSRANGYAELETFIEGPITDDQRWEKRIVEAQWYDRLTRQFLKLKLDDSLPRRVVHRWRQIRTADWLALLDAATNAYAEGMGWASREKVYEILRDGQATKFDPAELKGTPPPTPPTAEARLAKELKRIRLSQPATKN